jgi:hypothetical protein
MYPVYCIRIYVHTIVRSNVRLTLLLVVGRKNSDWLIIFLHMILTLRKSIFRLVVQSDYHLPGASIRRSFAETSLLYYLILR